jgi:hypothetical protein
LPTINKKNLDYILELGLCLIRALRVASLFYL